MSNDDVIEPFAIADQFCETLVRVDRLGPCCRLVLAVRDQSNGSHYRTVSAKLIMSAEAMFEIGRMMQEQAPTSEMLAAYHPHGDSRPN